MTSKVHRAISKIFGGGGLVDSYKPILQACNFMIYQVLINHSTHTL